ncbi:hypothetical protein J2Y02_000094 [Neobacillus drentensis]|nr:hypothetical protein [Neobacillus drentensis]
MLTKNTEINRYQIEMIALEQLVPGNQLVRKIEAAIDFSFIYSHVQDMYSSERGGQSIDLYYLLRWLSFNIPLSMKTCYLFKYLAHFAMFLRNHVSLLFLIALLEQFP